MLSFADEPEIVVVCCRNIAIFGVESRSGKISMYEQFLDIPDIVDKPPTPVPELRLPIEAVSPPELALPLVAVADKDSKKVGITEFPIIVVAAPELALPIVAVADKDSKKDEIAELPVTDVAAPELETCAVEDVELG
jgi:hypothetical protein